MRTNFDRFQPGDCESDDHILLADHDPIEALDAEMEAKPENFSGNDPEKAVVNDSTVQQQDQPGGGVLKDSPPLSCPDCADGELRFMPHSNLYLCLNCGQWHEKWRIEK